MRNHVVVPSTAPPPRLSWRGLAVVLLAAALAGWLVPTVPVAAHDLTSSATGDDAFVSALVALLVIVTAAVACWVCLVGVLLILGEVVPVTTLVASALAPRALRTLLCVALTTGAGATAASATTSGSPPDDGTRRTGVTALTGTVLPDRPVDTRALVAARPTTHLVRTGESLWSIAQDALPEGADVAEVDMAWRAWYAANRHTIGADPDRLVPGQRLVGPADGGA